jgi:hypothetical protein
LISVLLVAVFMAGVSRYVLAVRMT